MSYQTIQTVLDARVATATAIPPIHTENVHTKAVSGTPFTRTTLLPARPLQVSVGAQGRDQLQGLFQVDVYYPIASGTDAAGAAVEQIVALFPRGWSETDGTTTVRAVRCWREAGRQWEQWYCVPVVVEWRCIK